MAAATYLRATALATGVFFALAIFIIFKVETKQGLVKAAVNYNPHNQSTEFTESHISIFTSYSEGNFNAANCAHLKALESIFKVDDQKCQRATNAVWVELAAFIVGFVALTVPVIYYVSNESMARSYSRLSSALRLTEGDSAGKPSTSDYSAIFFFALFAVGICNLVCMAFILDYAVEWKNAESSVNVKETIYTLQFGLTCALLALNTIWLFGLAAFWVESKPDPQYKMVLQNILQE